MNFVKKTTTSIVSGIHKYLIERIIWMHLFLIALKLLKSPKKVMTSLLKLENMRRSYMGDHSLKRIIKVDQKYSWHPNIPAWPSKAFTFFHENELNKIFPFRQNRGELNTLILSITKKCPLDCEHCFEWDVMHKKEVLSLADLKRIIKNQQDKGLASIEFSGGEPLNRFQDLIKLVAFAAQNSETWVLTSGYGLTEEKALALKTAGLRGITVSLDHFEASKHNAFRGNEHSFSWVKKALKKAQSVGLVTSLSLCATRKFVSNENLIKYLKLSKELGVAFVQILEPRAKGRYSGKSVLLNQEQIKIINNFQIKINTDKKYIDYPLVIFHGYYPRTMGCLGGGIRYQYIDSNGDIFSCPFCENKMGNALNNKSIKDQKSPVCDFFEFSKM